MAIDDRAPQLRAVAIFNLVLAVISTFMRVYARGRIQRMWKLEDWLMIAAFASLLSNVTTCLLGLNYGTGKHMADLQPQNIMKAMMFWWACYPTFIITMILSKCSVGVFLNRITGNKVHHWIMYFAMGLTLIPSIAFFFVTIFQCSPVDYFWKQGDPAVQGSCINMGAISSVSYAYSAASIFTDLIFVLLPIHIVMGLQMDLKTKLALVPIFAMAMIASIACIIRLAYLPKFSEGDFLWNTADVVIWSETEQGLAVAAGNLATCRPLFRLTVEKFNSWTGRTTRSSSPTSDGSGERRSSVKRLLTPGSIQRRIFGKWSFSREIEVQTDVDVSSREKSSVAEAYSKLQPSTGPRKKVSSAWLDSTMADSTMESKCDSDDEFHVGNRDDTYCHAV